MKVIILNKETRIELDKNNIIEVLETADGLAFNMKGNLSLIFTDNFFPSNAKQLVKGAVDRCQAVNGTITVDLQDYATPARIEAGLIKPTEKKEEEPKPKNDQTVYSPPPGFAR